MCAAKHAAGGLALLLAALVAGPAAAQKRQDLVAVDITPVLMEVFNNIQAYVPDQVRHIAMLPRHEAAKVCGVRNPGSRCVAKHVTRALLRKAQENIINFTDGGGRF